MEVSDNFQVLLNNPQLLPELKDIAEKVLHNQ
ncbi:MAG: hypothetical protein JWR76_439, partial [Mucilaginibacter sp.]|nr:hypothetical protein [Mucilaginibacter sp.]MDB5285796.1 hypothetical protein [Mucilaginibacter sp.]